MSTQYQNWQNASSNEQYLTAAMMLERAEADDVLMEAFKEFPHDAKSGRSLRMPRWCVRARGCGPRRPPRRARSMRAGCRRCCRM